MIFIDRISRLSHGEDGVWFGNLSTASLLFADDVVLLASSSQDLQCTLVECLFHPVSSDQIHDLGGVQNQVVFCAPHKHLSTSFHHSDTSFPEIGSTAVVSSANLMTLLLEWTGAQLSSCK